MPGAAGNEASMSAAGPPEGAHPLGGAARSDARAEHTGGPARVVLDTNVAVALIVFRDPTLAALAARWASGGFEAIADPATLAEFDRVLGYPELRLDHAVALAVRRDYRSRCTIFTDRAPGHPALPRCTDPDDEMFLRLAHHAGAGWLLTRDKALLGLRRKVRFRIALPEAFESGPQGQTTRNGNRSLSESPSASGS